MANKAWVEAQAVNLARNRGSIHWHPTVKGLYIRVSPKGKAVYAVKYDGPDGKPIDATLGLVAGAHLAPVGSKQPISLDEAVSQYEEMRRVTFNPGKVLEGLDKAGEVTLKKAVERWFENHRTAKGKRRLKPATVDYYRTGLRRYFGDAMAWDLGAKTTLDWLDRFKQIQARSPTWARGMYHLIVSIYDMHVDADVLEKNPVRKRIIADVVLDAELKKVRKGHVQQLDMPAFWSAVQSRRTPTRLALETLTLSGWRKSAVLRMTWECVDLESCIYTIPADGVGWKGLTGRVAFGEYMRDVLIEQREYLEAHGALGEYVFPARHGDGAPFLQDVRGGLEPIEILLGYHLIPHDLRRTFTTVGDMVYPENGALVGRLIGHRHRGLSRGEEESQGSRQTEAYVQRALARDRIAATKVQEMLLMLAGVLPLSREAGQTLQENGIDPKALQLAEFPDDDEGEELLAA